MLTVTRLPKRRLPADCAAAEAGPPRPDSSATPTQRPTEELKCRVARHYLVGCESSVASSHGLGSRTTGRAGRVRAREHVLALGYARERLNATATDANAVALLPASAVTGINYVCRLKIE